MNSSGDLLDDIDVYDAPHADEDGAKKHSVHGPIAEDFCPTDIERNWISAMRGEGGILTTEGKANKNVIQRSFALWVPEISKENRVAGTNAVYGRCEILSREIESAHKGFSAREPAHSCKFDEDLLPEHRAWYPWSNSEDIDDERTREVLGIPPVRPINFYNVINYDRFFDSSTRKKHLGRDKKPSERDSPSHMQDLRWSSTATGDVLMPTEIVALDRDSLRERGSSADISKPVWRNMTAEVAKSDSERNWDIGDIMRFSKKHEPDSDSDTSTTGSPPRRNSTPDSTIVLPGSFWANSTPLSVSYLMERRLGHLKSQFKHLHINDSITDADSIQNILFGVGHDIGDRLLQLTQRWGTDSTIEMTPSMKMVNVQWDEIHM